MPERYSDLMVSVVYATPPLSPPDWWFLDNGLPIPPPEPTPAEKAWAILEPHLADVPLYWAGCQWPPVG